MIANGFLYALFAGILPSLIWLWFWLREDNQQPEPRFLLTGLFLSGIAAVLLAIFGEKFIASVVTDISTRYTLWAALEEVFKFVAVAAIAMHTRYYDEPIDAMVYCITVALGFAALENTLFIMGPFSDGSISTGIVTGGMRFMGATLVHLVSSGVIGFALGLTFYKGYLVKFFAALLGLGAAIALHAAFNLSIINAVSSDTLRTFGWVWGAVVLLIVFFEEVKVVRPKLL